MADSLKLSDVVKPGDVIFLGMRGYTVVATKGNEVTFREMTSRLRLKPKETKSG